MNPAYSVAGPTDHAATRDEPTNHSASSALATKDYPTLAVIATMELPIAAAAPTAIAFTIPMGSPHPFATLTSKPMGLSVTVSMGSQEMASGPICSVLEATMAAQVPYSRRSTESPKASQPTITAIGMANAVTAACRQTIPRCATVQTLQQMQMQQVWLLPEECL